MDRYRDTINVGDIFMTSTRKSLKAHANVPHVVLDVSKLLRHNSYYLTVLTPSGSVTSVCILDDYEFNLATILRPQ